MSAAPGAAPALVSAALFGASTPLAKLLLDGIDPLLLPDSSIWAPASDSPCPDGRPFAGGHPREAPLRAGSGLWLGRAIVFGGVVAHGL